MLAISRLINKSKTKSINQQIKTKTAILQNFSYNLIPKLLVIEIKSLERLNKVKIDEISHKYNNSSSIVEKIILMIKINSKIYKLKIFKEAITDFIYFRQ